MAIPYTVTWLDNKPYSVCEDFVTKDTELISAQRVLQLRQKANYESVYLHYVNLCHNLGIDIVHALDQMIVLDYIIANEDRHFNNFGLLRHPETLEWIGAAPVYDSGTSLWYDTPTKAIPHSDVESKPFKRKHGEQLKLVSSFEWLDFSKLDGIEDDIMNIFADEKTARYIDDERAKTIASQVRTRVDILERIAASHISHDTLSATDDITEDTAARYD